MASKSSKFAALIAAVGITLAAPVAAHAQTIDVPAGGLSFLDSATIGYEAAYGDSWTYENVVTVSGQSVDAVVTIADDYSLDWIDAVDKNGNASIDSYLNFINRQAYISYSIEFFEAGTSTPITLHGLNMHVKDIDDYQYLQLGDIASHNLSTVPATTISVLDNSDNSDIPVGELRFQGGETLSEDFSDQDYWVSVAFNDASVIYLTVGTDNPNHGFNDAIFVFEFTNAAWSVANGGTDDGSNGGSNGGNGDNSLAATGNQAGLQAATGFGLMALGAVVFAIRRKHAN